MSGLDLITEIDGPVARITFNRPEVRNALNAAMLTGMAEFLGRIEDDPAVGCLVLAGAGDHFMAGGDVAGFATQLDKPPVERAAEFTTRAARAIPVFEAMARFPKPIVAKVRGAAAGASISWVAAADFALASDTALFVFAHIHLGLSPDAGLTYFLPRVVGHRKATELILLGGRLDAQAAADAGLVTKVVPDADLDSAVDALVAKLVSSPGTAVVQARRLLAGSAERTLSDQLVAETESFGTCAATADFVEGVSAFVAKRKPRFGLRRAHLPGL